MKRALLSFMVIIAAITTGHSQFTKTGVAITTGTGVYYNKESSQLSYKTGNPAITLTGVYEVTMPVQITPSFSYFFPRITTIAIAGAGSSKRVVSCMMFDITGHYVFNSLDRFEFYGLTGLNITFLVNKWITKVNAADIKTVERDNSFGLNIGAGTMIKLTNQFDLYGEAKYILGRYGQFVFNVGALINIDWLIKEEKSGI